LLLTGPPHYPLAMRDVDALLALQRSHGITRSVVYSPMEIQRAFFTGDDPWPAVRRYNEFVAQIQERYPDEVTGVGLVYPFGGDESAHEAEHIIQQLGLHGVMVNPYLRGQWLDQDERAEPLLGTVERMGVPLLVHPEEQLERVAAEALGRRMRYAEGLVLWRTLATTFAMYGFAAGPLFQRFPGLRIVFAHGGGSFWGNAARVEVLFKELVPREDPIVRGQWEGETGTEDPLAWMRAHEVYMDTAWLDGGALFTAVQRLGADRLLFGTDGSAHAASIPFFQAQLAELGLTPSDVEKIQFDNTARLFSNSGGD
jgi:aminocarboxymuconate-semialdehyde decarboxylase